jgi:hypothetical protein
VFPPELFKLTAGKISPLVYRTLLTLLLKKFIVISPSFP